MCLYVYGNREGGGGERGGGGVGVDRWRKPFFFKTVGEREISTYILIEGQQH